MSEPTADITYGGLEEQEIRLDFEIIPSNNCKKLILIDTSQYAYLPVDQEVRLLVTLPGYPVSKPLIFWIRKGVVNVLNGYNLGLTDDPNNLPVLPDGIWQFSLQTCPFEDFTTTKNYLRNCIQRCNLRTQFITLDLLCDSCVTKEKQLLLNQIEMLISASEANTELCNINVALSQYIKANELLSKLIDKDRAGCINCK